MPGGMSDAISRGIAKRLEQQPAQSDADKKRAAEEAQRRLGYGKPNG